VNLRRWDIVFVRENDKDSTGHPGVVLSPEDMLEDSRHLRINVVMGSKKTPAYPAQPRHVILNGADGLDHSTVIDCARVVVVRKSGIIRLAGTVSLDRRREISRKVRAYLGLG
jgi:hypothetical protein